MKRLAMISAVTFVATSGLAIGEGASQRSGDYGLTSPRHQARVNKVEAIGIKQKQAKKRPKAKTFCLPPGDSKPKTC